MRISASERYAYVKFYLFSLRYAHIHGMKAKRKPLNITISPLVKEALDSYAAAHGESASRVIENLLRDVLKKEGWLEIRPPEKTSPLALAAEEPATPYGKRTAR